MVWEGYLEGVGRLLRRCEEAVWRVKEAVCRVYERLSHRCRKAILNVWVGCLDGVERLSRRGKVILDVWVDCEKAVKMWGGCLECVGWLSKGCGEVV